MPVPVKAIQIDGGGKFWDEFEKTVADKGMILDDLPTSTPGPMAPSNAATPHGAANHMG